MPKPKIKRCKDVRKTKTWSQEVPSQNQAAIKSLQNEKVAGIDEMRPEQIRHFGTMTKKMVIKSF